MSEVYVTRSAPPQSCLSRSKEWEGRLERALRLWHQVQQKAQPVEEWMTRAEDVLTQTGDDIDQLITDHKVHTLSPGAAAEVVQGVGGGKGEQCRCGKNWGCCLSHMFPICSLNNII